MLIPAKYKRDDEKFESLLDSFELEVSDTEFTPEKKLERRAGADKDEFEFCKIYYPKIFDQPFNEMHRSIRKLNAGKHTRSGARKIGKSAYAYVAKAIRRIALGNGGLIGILMRTIEKGAKERTAALKRLIERNKLLCYDYDINIQQDLKGYYIINNTTMIAISVDTALRGIIDDDFKRFSVVIGDDLYSKNTVASEHDNKKVTNFITSEVWGQMEDDGLCLILGNSINDDCPIVRLKNEHPENHFSLPAIIDGKTCWPESEIHTLVYWNNIKAGIPFDVWMGEYMDDPLTEGNVFKLNWLRSVNLNLIKLRAVITHIDPAHGQSPSACYKAMVTLAETTHDKYILLDVYLRKESWDKSFSYVNAVRECYPGVYKSITFENDFDQWSGARLYYDLWMKKTGIRLPIFFVNAKNMATLYHGADKHGRCMHLVFPFETGLVLINSAIFDGAGESGICRTHDMELWRAQFIGYDGTDNIKIDGIDATAGAFILIPRFSGSGGGFADVNHIHGDYHNENAWINR